MSTLDKKLADLPKEPGVYLYKDASGAIIYIGKAAVLKNRVRQYFQKNHNQDVKTRALVADIADVEWMVVDSEIDALFLEAELVRRYLPKYNILLRDDKSMAYIRIDHKSHHPTVSITRRPLDDGAEYFGPYFAATSIKKALHYLRRAFPYSTHVQQVPKRACLHYHLGLCPGLEENKTSLADYNANLKKLAQYLRGQRKQLVYQIEKEMKQAAAAKQFELAASLRNQLHALRALSKQIVFSDAEFLDINKDQSLRELAELLGQRMLRRIEGYDISHISGVDNAASMVVFVNGLPSKKDYRKLKMRLEGNNDFVHMYETISRRLTIKNVKDWGLPDLFVIDGGSGQLHAALRARDECGHNSVPMIGLAKRKEEIVIAKKDAAISLKKIEKSLVKESNNFYTVLLPQNSPAVKLLQRIRDESHRFAVSYHTVLKRKRQTTSILDDVPGVGVSTKKKLLRHFGSLKAVRTATIKELAGVVGSSKARAISAHLVHQREDTGIK